MAGPEEGPVGAKPRQQVRHCGVLGEMGHFHSNLCCLGSVRGRRGLPGGGTAAAAEPGLPRVGVERAEGQRGRAPRVWGYCAFPTSDCIFPTWDCAFPTSDLPRPRSDRVPAAGAVGTGRAGGSSNSGCAGIAQLVLNGPEFSSNL